VSRFLAWIKADSALILYAVQAVLAVIVAFGISPSPGWTAAVVTITAALITIATGILTRPVRVSVITGAVATILTAAAAFGLHLSSAQTGAGVTALSVVLALVLRQNISPALTAAAKPPAQS
jgi:hypothetical protein